MGMIPGMPPGMAEAVGGPDGAERVKGIPIIIWYQNK